MFRVGLIQLNGTDDPDLNLDMTTGFVSKAADDGAELVATPEVTNLVSFSRARQTDVLRREEDDKTLSAICDLAAQKSIWVLIGSLALKTSDPDGRFANRSFLINPDGLIKARYDKIHMFDAVISETESYSESKGYRPGDEARIVDIGQATIGMSICYDIRFANLYRDLAQAGAGILSVPGAFTVETGKAHLETLMRARAIETGSFVIGPMQTGDHSVSQGRARSTYGHSMIVDPWGQVLADAGTEPGVTMCDLDLSDIAKARSKIPSLAHGRKYTMLGA